MSTMTVQIRRKGTITLPAELRRQYRLGEGDIFTLVDMGDGSFLLTPRISQVARWGDQVSRAMSEANVTLDDMLTALNEERERYHQEHNAQGQPLSGQ
jgi:AbrB family looped-hinge helix DNA binding protein